MGQVGPVVVNVPLATAFSTGPSASITSLNHRAGSTPLLGASRHRGRRLAVRGERLPLTVNRRLTGAQPGGASCTGMERSEPPVFFGIELLSGRCPLFDRRRRELVLARDYPCFEPWPSAHGLGALERSRRRGASRARWKMDASPARCTASSAMASQTESAWMPGSSLSILALTSSTLSEPTIFSSCAWSSSRRSPCGGPSTMATSQSLSGRWSCSSLDMGAVGVVQHGRNVCEREEVDPFSRGRPA